MQGFDGVPETALFEHSNYEDQSASNNDIMPATSFSTQLGVGDLPPMPAEHTYVYHNFHFELERWAIFRMLP